MIRRPRLARDICLGLALFAAAGCGGGSSSASSSSMIPANFDFGNNNHLKATAFGDSITQGVLELKRRDFWLTTTGNNYPSILQSRLRSLDPAWHVVNRGRGGERTSEGVARLPSVLAIDKPGFVLIMEGTNDAHACRNRANIFNNIQNLVRTAKGNKSIPIIGTIPPSFRNNLCADEIIDEVNANIRGFAAGEPVVLAEIFNAMNRRELFGLALDRDPLHPNEEGYRVMADVWFQAIFQAIPGGATAALRRRR